MTQNNFREWADEPDGPHEITLHGRLPSRPGIYLLQRPGWLQPRVCEVYRENGKALRIDYYPAMAVKLSSLEAGTLWSDCLQLAYERTT